MGHSLCTSALCFFTWQYAWDPPDQYMELVLILFLQVHGILPNMYGWHQNQGASWALWVPSLPQIFPPAHLLPSPAPSSWEPPSAKLLQHKPPPHNPNPKSLLSGAIILPTGSSLCLPRLMPGWRCISQSPWVWGPHVYLLILVPKPTVKGDIPSRNCLANGTRYWWCIDWVSFSMARCLSGHRGGRLCTFHTFLFRLTRTLFRSVSVFNQGSEVMLIAAYLVYLRWLHVSGLVTLGLILQLAQRAIVLPSRPGSGGGCLHLQGHSTWAWMSRPPSGSKTP